MLNNGPMISGDTIIACSTGASRAARALVRLSGPDVPRLARAIAGEVGPRIAATGVLRLRDLVSSGIPHELPVLCVRFAAPASYTGEDMLELSLPGNPILVERVIDAMITEKISVAENMPEAAPTGGIRRAEPGEFSARAFLHAKLTLEQAEGVAGIIAARTGEQLAAADRLLRGTTGERYRAWTDELATLLALVEAGIDFTDQEDVVAIAPAELARRARAVDEAIARELGSAHSRATPGVLPVVLIVGEPNAGKSTLFNALLGTRRAIESPQRGTTRDVLREELDLGTHIPGAGRVMLCDSAGLDESIAIGPSESAAQSATRAAIVDADVIVHCDPTGEFSQDLVPRDVAVRVRTKSDRASGASAPSSALGARSDIPVRVGASAPGIPTVNKGASSSSSSPIPICALDGWNLDLLRRAIADAAGVGGSEGLAVARHAAALRAARAALVRIITDIDPAARALHAPETIAESLREALDHLGAISGRLTTEDILGKVFSSFCVGK